MHPCWAALPLPSVHLRFPPPHQYDCPIYHRLSWGQSHSGVNGTQTGLSELFYIYFMNWVYWNFKLCRMFAWRCGGERGKSWAFKAFSYYKPHSATNTNTHKSFFPISKSFNIAFTLRHMHQFGVQYISQGYFGGLVVWFLAPLVCMSISRQTFLPFELQVRKIMHNYKISALMISFRLCVYIGRDSSALKKKAVLILRFNCSVDFNTTDVLIIGPLSSLAVKSSLTQLTE